ncbi:497_t:CDS:2 [Acaulospora morrowiae]|uniref:497_t:CDS:1 n=1 Tax=Acaulospora morrowiae TaxID=94023 RepID=A0A9N9CKJ1_9GLOM|nr:497_t:CDS:2 [Acaulospora morrowiae]
MPADSGFVDNVDLQKHNSFHQWTPRHSLSSADITPSRSMSQHLHSTSRRVFIGPTPMNWNYKKRSLLFSKSDQVEHHGKKTFRAESYAIGPNNVLPLDYSLPQDEQRNSFEMISDKPFLVNEPLEVIDSDLSSPSSDDEAFYTPSEVLSSKPPVCPVRENEIYKPETHSPNSSNSHPLSNLMLPPSIIEIPPEENNDHLENSGSMPSEITAGSPHSLQNDDAAIEATGHLGVHNILTPDTASVASFLNNHSYEPGSVIEEDRMLVRVERDYHTQVPQMHESSSQNLVYSTGWREYIVKLRPEKIELYKNKKDKVDKVVFSSKTKLSLYSTVDYTLALIDPYEHGTKVIILRPKTRSLSAKWYLLLRGLFPESVVKPIPSVCEVSVPDLNVKIRIPLEDGDRAFRVTAEEVTKVVLDQLSGVSEWEDVLNEWMEHGDLRLCWKRYDRLEWIIWEKNDGNVDRNDLLVCPQFIERTHHLQLRVTQHYPTSVTLADGSKLMEPPPAEGYLIRITNNKGRKKNAKRLYFSTHDYYFFYMKPFSMCPPPPPKTDSLDTNGENQCIDKRPLIYAIAPQIQGQVEENGTFMKADLKRRYKQVVSAIGFINLIEVVEVRPHRNDNNGDHKYAEGEGRERETQGKGSPFELVMKNNKIIVLQAYSHETRDEWIKRLSDLVRYWKARVESDAQTRINMLKINQSNENQDEDHVSMVDGDIQEHFNNFKSYANPAVWHWCTLNGCRDLTKTGLLYHKSHLHGTFRNYHHVLTRGHFIYFNVYSRSISGRAIRRCYHKRNGIIDLSNCYVYSGSITEYDLLYSNSSRYSLASSGAEHKLPRIYEDGMYCYDDEEECTFVIWKGKRTSTLEFSGEKKSGLFGLDVKKKVKLDHPGKTWVFRARSRTEREEWVWALNVEIERLCDGKKRDK